MHAIVEIMIIRKIIKLLKRVSLILTPSSGIVRNISLEKTIISSGKIKKFIICRNSIDQTQVQNIHK